MVTAARYDEYWSEFLESEQMSVSRSMMDELEVTLQTGSNAKRTETLRRVTDLFLNGADNFSTEQISLFDDVLNRLIAHIEGTVLAELSVRLAPVTNAPAGVIRRLARDDNVVISGPVLQQSERLTDDDLVEIANSKSQEHLFKISGRPGLTETVTDVLVDRGNSEVVNEVAANTGARFSHIGFSKLVICADGDDRLTATVARRPDIPPRLLRYVLARATDAVRERLMTSAQPGARETIRRILVDVSRQMRGSLAPRQYAEAERLVRSLSQDTALTKSKVLEFADAHRITETVVALSVLTAVPIDLVDCLVNNPGHFGALVLCKAIGLDWTVARSVMVASRRREEMAPSEIVDLCEEYQQLSVSTAQRLLRFWQARQEHAAAAERHVSSGPSTERNHLGNDIAPA